MSKKLFVSAAMMASISEGVNIRERANEMIDSVVNERILAQLDAEMMDGGNDVSYYGPENHSPNLSANMTPFNSMDNMVESTVMA